MQTPSITAPLPKTLVDRARRFLASPAPVKYTLLARRLKFRTTTMAMPVQLSFGSWWLAENGGLDQQLRSGGTFEPVEMSFVSRILRAGMTVLDIGAHHGLYTLLASKRVGRSGRVIAFEPSPRESKRLKRHVQVNGCRNVQIETVALGASKGQANLFLVQGTEDYCNSLRPPAVEAQTESVSVEITTLDEFLVKGNLGGVDFVKLDVEGAELDVLRGARKLLQTPSRPTLLVEVYDIRTQPWGYQARDIVKFVFQNDYQWFELVGDGMLRPIRGDKDVYDANLIAVPSESVGLFLAACGIG